MDHEFNEILPAKDQRCLNCGRRKKDTKRKCDGGMRYYTDADWTGIAKAFSERHPQRPMTPKAASVCHDHALKKLRRGFYGVLVGDKSNNLTQGRKLFTTEQMAGLTKGLALDELVGLASKLEPTTVGRLNKQRCAACSRLFRKRERITTVSCDGVVAGLLCSRCSPVFAREAKKANLLAQLDLTRAAYVKKS